MSLSMSDISSQSMIKPLLIYDGDCGFCRRWIVRWQFMTGDKIRYEPYQKVGEQYPHIAVDSFRKSVKLVDIDGTVYSGAKAVFLTLKKAGRGAAAWWLYEKIELFRRISEWFYSRVAENRVFFSHLTRFLWGDDLRPSTYHVAVQIFLRGLGLIYLCAFVSLWTQIDGLIGSQGISPFIPFLAAIQERIGVERYWLLPTLAWIFPQSLMPHILSAGGVILSLLLVAGIFPVSVLSLLYVFYLSLFHICREFLGFQWDILLLEAGFLAIFLAPLRMTLRWDSQRFSPSRMILGLHQWLLFRLMFASGIVKLMSGDPTWRNLTALTYHYQTQPLPTWMAWFVHQLPEKFHRVSAAGMFAVELLVPFLIFMPRRLKLTGAVAIALFQTAILLTGNYCFFNLMTILLCVLLIDDGAWNQLSKRRSDSEPQVGNKRRSFWPAWVTAPVMILVVTLSGISLMHQAGINPDWPQALLNVRRFVSPFHVANSYGLFAVMTTERNEIVIEGSMDGENWQPYEFRYKPQDPKRKPGFIIPHQPRLDWQMWFAALSAYQQNDWFINFCVRLLEGSPEVLSLLAHNPFPDKPPVYIRVSVYQYTFTDSAAKKSEGLWWKMNYRGLYCPILSLKDNAQ